MIKDRIFELGEKLGQTIIFVRTRRDAGRLHKELVDLGYAVTTIQGAVSAEDRDKIVQEFKNNLTKVLISTDLLARGFDQQQVHPPSPPWNSVRIPKECLNFDIWHLFLFFCRLIWLSTMIFRWNMKPKSLIMRCTCIELVGQGVLVARVSFSYFRTLFSSQCLAWTQSKIIWY